MPKLTKAQRRRYRAEERMWWFLHILASVQGVSDASDSPHGWVNAFCDDLPDPEDTFNRAERLGFTTVSHDTSFDVSTVYLTAAGRAALAQQGGRDG